MTLEERIKQLETDLATAKAEVTSLQNTIGEKDALLAQKTNDVVQARRKYKHLSEMTESERASLTEREREVIAHQEDLDKKTEELEKKRLADLATTRNERVQNAIRRIAGENKELAGKIETNLKMLKGADEAATEADVNSFVTNAFNMLGEARPDPVAQAIELGMSGGEPGDAADFAATERGKAALAELGMVTPAPQAPQAPAAPIAEPQAPAEPQWGRLD